MGQHRGSMAFVVCLTMALCAALTPTRSFAASSEEGDGSAHSFLPTYANPLPVTLPDGTLQTNCADPTILQSPVDSDWYVWCTSDSLSDGDVDPSGARRHHLLPTLHSHDLVHWQNAGDAFAAPPAWLAPTSDMWAPEVVYRDGLFYLYYTATDVGDAASPEPGCGSDSAVGLATSPSPTGPWTDTGAPVVAPRRNGAGCDFFWTYDPDVVDAGGQMYIYYGSFYGGVEARPLSADGRSTSADAAVAITIPNRYEGSDVVAHGGAYWLFASASNCCNGPLTGYQVFVGRAASPLGPFVDRDGKTFLEGQVGGTPALALAGNRWVGTGHNSVFQDAEGNWFTVFHAVDDTDPYFAGSVGYTKRHLLLDRLDWDGDSDGGWPVVRDGLGASDTPQPAPVAQVEDPSIGEDARAWADAWSDLTDPNAFLLALDHLDVTRLQARPDLSDEFSGSAVGPQWSWVREPAAGGYDVEGGAFDFATENADLYGATNDASVLVEAVPAGDYLVETKVALSVPDSGCCYNFTQAGLVIYGGDDAFIKLAHFANYETRQIEFAKEIPDPAPGYPFYGSGVEGPPGDTTWLRIAMVLRGTTEHYVSFTSVDGTTWRRGGVWDDSLESGGTARIGLVSMGGAGWNASFDYVHVYDLPTP